MTGVFQIMLIHGIIDDTLQITFIIAHHEFKTVLIGFSHACHYTRDFFDLRH